MLTETNHPRMSVYLALSRAISRTTTVEEICGIALEALADGLGVSRSAILLFDADGVMRFKASRRLSEGYRAAVEGHTPWGPDSLDPEPIIVVDVAKDASLAPFLPIIEAEGIGGMAFIPLMSHGRVIGKFMVYYDSPHRLRPDEVQLASLIAAQVGFAVERTRAEEQARRSEAWLRYALDAANVGTWDWDVRSGSLRWSDNLERIHGVPPGTFDSTFQSYEQEIHPDDRGRVLASIQRALAQGAPHEVEYRIVAPDGTIRWVEGKGHVERGADGRPVRMSGVCVNITPRKHAELARLEALEESARASQQLAAIVESSGDAIVSKDLNSVIMSWNRAAERMFGYTAEEAIGRSITMIIPRERLAEEQVVLTRVRAGEPVEMETVRRRKDGTLVPISLMVSPVRDASGRIVGASKVGRDISARLQMEAERAELHRRLATLVTASSSLLNSPETQSVTAATIALAQQLLVADGYAVWATDPEGSAWHAVGSKGVSDDFANCVLVARDDGPPGGYGLFADPLAVSDVLTHPLLQARAEAYREEGIRSMLVCPMRLGGQRAGTLVFYYRERRVFGELDLETGQTLANLAAAAIKTADLYEDLRTQRNAAEAARRQAAFLADATAILSRSLDYEQTLAAVARLAVPEIADWCVVNMAGSRGRGTELVAVAHADPAKAEQARALYEQYPPDPEMPGGIHEVIRTGTPVLVESLSPERVAASARNEEHRMLLESLGLTSYLSVPLVSASGTLGAITFVQAESGRHFTERDLALLQELAARAALAIENAFAYRRVHEASRVKDEFLATLSHELRTPLNAILGYAQMLNMGALHGNRRAHAMAVLMRNAESLRQMIDDVLDVSRITSGKLRLTVQPVAMGEILRNAAATVQPAADAKGVSMHAVLDPDVPQVSGDPDRLQQIVWNLLSNAVKFTPPGGWVELRLQQAGSAVQIVVRDNGQGIEPAFLPHTFERFRQADSRFSREHGGLGLGLAIVRELTELHGGTVSAASDGTGRGATFTVRLPPLRADIAHAVADGGIRPPAPASALAAARERLDGLRVLAVDNEEDSLSLLRVVLETAGADVATAQSAPEAIDLLRAGGIDVLVSDIGMPQMDGFELIRSVRRLPTPAASVPAAALTAYARSEDRVAALASGYQMHLPKPLNPADLVSAVATLAGR